MISFAACGLAVGHATDVAGGTGCTVVRGIDAPFRCGVHVVGRATGTRELALLDAAHLVDRVDAILLCRRLGVRARCRRRRHALDGRARSRFSGGRWRRAHRSRRGDLRSRAARPLRCAADAGYGVRRLRKRDGRWCRGGVHRCGYRRDRRQDRRSSERDEGRCRHRCVGCRRPTGARDRRRECARRRARRVGRDHRRRARCGRRVARLRGVHRARHRRRGAIR